MLLLFFTVTIFHALSSLYSDRQVFCFWL